MKIAYFTDTYLPSISGVVTSLVNIVTILAEKKYEIIVYAPKPKLVLKIAGHNKNPRVHFLSSMPGFVYPGARISFPFPIAFLRKVKKFDPDIIHVQTPFFMAIGALIIARMLKKPLVGSFHGYFMEPEYIQVLGINKFAKTLSKILWRYTVLFYNQCDIVVVPAANTKEELIKHKIIKPIVVIANTVQEKKIKRVTENEIQKLKTRYNLKEQTILYTGRLSKEKSLDILIKSFVNVLKKHDSVSLLIVGDGPIKKDLVKLVKNFGVEDSVIFTGNIHQDKLLTEGYYQVGDIFATASTTEVLPVSIIEAMYFGLPIIGVAKKGMTEMISGIGLLSTDQAAADFTKNLMAAIEDKTLRKKLSERSKDAFNKKYSVKQVASKYESLYSKLISQRKINS